MMIDVVDMHIVVDAMVDLVVDVVVDMMDVVSHSLCLLFHNVCTS